MGQVIFGGDLRTSGSRGFKPLKMSGLYVGSLALAQRLKKN